MKYKSISIHDYDSWYRSFLKNIHEVWISVDRDCITVDPGIFSKYKFVPDNATLVKLHHVGGTIVGFPGSITLFAFTKSKMAPKWKEDLVTFLTNKGLNARINGNDVLVDGYKVAGAMVRKFGDTYYYHGIHISINCDAELISQIVVKSQLKIPKGLSDYGITREEILRALGVEIEGDLSE